MTRIGTETNKSAGDQQHFKRAPSVINTVLYDSTYLRLSKNIEARLLTIFWWIKMQQAISGTSAATYKLMEPLLTIVSLTHHCKSRLCSALVNSASELLDQTSGTHGRKSSCQNWTLPPKRSSLSHDSHRNGLRNLGRLKVKENQFQSAGSGDKRPRKDIFVIFHFLLFL